MSGVGAAGQTRRGARLRALAVLLPYLRPYRWRVIGAVLALLATSALLLGIGQGVRRLIDRGFAGGSAAQLNTTSLAMFAVVAALAVGTAARFVLISWLGERVAADLRRDMFERVIGLSAAFFETARTGDILSRLTADISVLQALVGSSVSLWLRSALLVVGGLTMLVVTSAKLAAIVLLVIPLVMLPLVLFGRRERRLSRQTQDRIADLGAYAEETLAGLRTVQAFTHEPVDRARFAEVVELSVATALRRIASRAALLFGVILLGFGAIVFALWVGGHDVIAGRMSGGALSAFVFYAVVLATSGAQMSELWGELQRASGAAERLGELLDERPTIAAPARPALLPARAEGRVSLEAVTFHYPARPDAPALRGFSLDVSPGQTVALVGPSGAGKTTVLQLLLRFYDPERGVVRLDGGGRRAARPGGAAGADRHRAAGPGDLQRQCGREHPLRPSGGERRRGARRGAGGACRFPRGAAGRLRHVPRRQGGAAVRRAAAAGRAIARAILRDPAVLLLDEATSALDAESEQAVQQALAALSRGRTTVVVAHRLATVVRADRIVVVEAGEVVATGTHAALITQGGLYARLAALQFGMA